jgi:peptidoglycan hydrolase-like protein with peptidoglycan-binding domain
VRRLKWLLATAAVAVAALVGTTVVALPASAASFPIVQQGASGADVYAIQHLLTHHNHATTPDGAFGPNTYAKVRSFQQAKGLTVDGIVGPQTWGALIVTVRNGSSGHAVRAAQRELNKHGFGVTVDGQFGPQTDAATRRFQQQVGIAADGVIGPITWRELTGRSGSGGGTGADLCARVGYDAGFRGERLVTAVAVALAESSCRPSASNTNGPTAGCPNGSTDRGLWQINNCYHPSVTNTCAYNAACNARAAYSISSSGSNWQPWSTYNSGRYRSFLTQARAAVNRLG